MVKLIIKYLKKIIFKKQINLFRSSLQKKNLSKMIKKLYDKESPTGNPSTTI